LFLDTSSNIILGCAVFINEYFHKSAIYGV
jgi:hypothetical protein